MSAADLHTRRARDRHLADRFILAPPVWLVAAPHSTPRLGGVTDGSIVCCPVADQKLQQLLWRARYYEPILKRLHPEDYPKRRKDLEHFASIAARYRSLENLLVGCAQRPFYGPLPLVAMGCPRKLDSSAIVFCPQRRLVDMALEPPTDSVGDVLAVDPEEGLLTLSTIHSAKGLEWHSVFVIWAAEGKFPSSYNVHDDDEIEEERRLMYVATTRPKEQLYLTYPINIFDRGLGMVMGKPSRFIEDLPVEQLRPVTLVEDSAPADDY